MPRSLFRFASSTFCCLVIAAGILAIPGAAAAENIKLRLNFSPWAMHAQYFAALKQGYYEEEGLQVEILSRSSGQQTEVLVGSGQDDFGVTNADAFIKARAKGIPLMAIALDQPDTAYALISRKDLNVTGPADLKGKKVAFIQGDEPGLIEPVLASGQITLDDIEILSVRFGAEQQLVASGEARAAFGYFYGQPVTLAAQGIETTTMLIKDYGVNLYGTLLIASEDTVKSRPEVVNKFLRATFKGYLWAGQNMEQAMRYVIDAAPDRNYDVELKKLHLIYDFYRTPAYKDGFGMMSEAGWQASIDTLAKASGLSPAPQASELFTNAFIENSPEAKKLSDWLLAE